MALAQYVVVKRDQQWRIMLNRKVQGVYPSQKMAISRAVDAAYQSGKAGNDAQVLVLEAGGQFRTEWTYGQDIFPMFD